MKFRKNISLNQTYFLIRSRSVYGKHPAVLSEINYLRSKITNFSSFDYTAIMYVAGYTFWLISYNINCNFFTLEAIYAFLNQNCSLYM